MLLYRGAPLYEQTVRELRAAASAMGFDVQIMSALEAIDYPPAFEAFKASGAQALLIGANARLFEHRTQLLALALKARLPTICEWATMARDGCLLGYGPNREVLYRNTASKIARIFQGIPPADLPIELPALFTFAVNLRTARTLGVDLPPSIITRADEVIE